MIAKKYNINKNCRRIHGDEGAIDIALAGIKEEFLICCGYANGEANKEATFFITLDIERPAKEKKK